MNTIFDFFRRLFGVKPPPPNLDDPCNAAQCVDATNRLADARRRFDNNCRGLQMTNEVLGLLGPIVATPIPVVIAIAIAAVLFALIGGPIMGTLAAILGGFIAIYGISWYLFLVVSRMSGVFGSGLTQAARDFEVAHADVLRACPEHCRGDTSFPACKT